MHTGNPLVTATGRSPYLFVLAILTFTLVWITPLDYSKSDPELTLLTSQALVQQGNINLFEYRYALPQGDFSHGEWKYSSRGEGTIYYTYPLGNSIIALPFVAVGNIFGLDMSLAEHDSFMQRLLAAISVLLVLFLFMDVIGNFLPSRTALVAAPLLVFSTSLYSTLGTALWSFNFEMVFLLLSVREVIAAERGIRSLRPFRLGGYLAMAWFCRPSAMVFAAIIFLWLFLKQRPQVLRVAGPIIVFLMLFVTFSVLTFQQILPPYYNPFYWTQTKAHPFGIFERMIALLFSPARGLFLFTPLLMLGLGGLLIPEVRKDLLYRFSMLWFVLQWMATATQANWWGGWCFGPRMMTESIIPLTLMLVLTWRGIHGRNGTYLRYASILLGGLGLFIHVFQGGFNKESRNWNDFPNIDQYPAYYIWNWKRSQIAATATGNRIKSREFEMGIQIGWMLRKLPQQGVLLYGKPDPEVRSILQGWNRHGGKKVFNNLFDVAVDQCDTFWISELNKDQIAQIPDFTILQDTSKISLGQYLRSMEGYNVVMVVKDEASTAILPQTKDYFRAAGAHIDSLKYRQGYGLCFSHGKLIMESLEGDQPAFGEVTIDGQKLTFFSSGMDKQNRSSIRLNDREYSLDRRGFNILVFDAQGNVMDLAWFDTLWSDNKIQMLFQVIKNRKVQNRK